ncbi:MAG: FCD domain-containing protein, partial [Gallionellaceae bacterium]
NRILADLMRSLRERTDLVFAPLSPKQAARNWDEHAAILAAVIAGDEALADLLASRHVLQAGERYLAEAGTGAEAARKPSPVAAEAPRPR